MRIYYIEDDKVRKCTIITKSPVTIRIDEGVRKGDIIPLQDTDLSQRLEPNTFYISSL